MCNDEQQFEMLMVVAYGYEVTMVANWGGNMSAECSVSPNVYW